MFAKLFGAGDDQVLVKLDTNDTDNPEIRFYIRPAGCEVCSISTSFADTDAGRMLAERAFHAIDETDARRFVAELAEFALATVSGLV